MKKEIDIMENEKETNLNSESDKTDKETLNESEEKKDQSDEMISEESNNKIEDSKDKKIEELTDRLMRSMAEFDNFRKRSEKEKSQMFDLGVKSLIEKLLPVIDNFERGIESALKEDENSSYVQGFEMIYKQLLNVLEEIGVKPIEALGKEFNPDYHNAVMHGEDENYGENIISEELQKGYMYNNTVVRHSMVKVVN